NFWISVSLWRPFASLNGRSLLVVNTERSSNDARLLSKPAGEVLTTKQAPHRPGIAPALGLRAGMMASSLYRGPPPVPGDIHHGIPLIPATARSARRAHRSEHLDGAEHARQRGGIAARCDQ